ncbi:MAG TPA: MgtC/SapB family protein [Candidatus Angelobacter sp.]|nr:MgtC/SapB family protein [Candidatus Angelobacter sp.]
MTGWDEFPRILLSLAIAFVLGLPIGWERGNPARPGLRTYPLLAMGACAYLEIGQFAFHNNADAQARVFQGLVSGIGFIGAGAIIKGRVKVHGLATAVSLWVTVAIGIAASYQLFALGIVLSGTTLLVLLLLDPKRLHPEQADTVDHEKSG